MKNPMIHTLAVGIGLGALALSSLAAAKPIPTSHTSSYQSQDDSGPSCGDEDDEEKKKKKS
ncbi:MAG: hypothetical protein H6718_04665 [Polyangiaceae bacterium]|nr:hypothetical protein [Myxococcales bacterium]MCB9584663.1 hypothetical protein [Polyangiaceae bacterium]MCB9609100.1 hypothetical protein [Polyangiaceae bacterium]